MDVFSKEKRSEIMSKIRSESELEKRFRKLLSAQIYPLGYRYRLNYRKVPGKPDIAFVALKIAVFIDGDFWHGYKFSERKEKLPKKYWLEKIEGNIKRDKRNKLLLKRRGWTYIRIWENEIRKNPEKCLEKIISALKK